MDVQVAMRSTSALLMHRGKSDQRWRGQEWPNASKDACCAGAGPTDDFVRKCHTGDASGLVSADAKPSRDTRTQKSPRGGGLLCGKDYRLWKT